MGELERLIKFYSGFFTTLALLGTCAYLNCKGCYERPKVFYEKPPKMEQIKDDPKLNDKLYEQTNKLQIK